MGKMTGNVSDPFCEIYMRDYRQNTQASIAEWKVLRASQLAVCKALVWNQTFASHGACSALGARSL
jgi:hypothetical protein